MFAKRLYSSKETILNPLNIQILGKTLAQKSISFHYLIIELSFS